jgi:hypothetical protein
VIQRHFREQSLEAAAIRGRLPADTLILVDNHYSIRRPSQLLRQFRQTILPFAGLAILEHLMRRRLPNVDDRQAFPSGGRELSTTDE